jgi:signal transduction histidine kinase
MDATHGRRPYGEPLMQASAARVRLDRSAIDVAVALALVIWGQIDLWVVGGAFTTVPGSRGIAAPFVVLFALPLAWRRRWPFGVLCVVMSAIATEGLVVGKSAEGGEVLFPMLLALYTVAAHTELRRAVLGFAIGFATGVVQSVFDPSIGSIGELFAVDAGFYVFLLGAVWLAGRHLRARRLEAERSEDRASRIEREQADRARQAAEAERGRIARELHDVIAHSVSLMGVQAGAAERVLERDPVQARDALRSIQSTARESVGELRRLLGILREGEEPAALSPQPGLGALEALVEETRHAGLPVTLTIDGQGRHLAPGVELSAFRVAQEALTNVRKHAPGASAEILVRWGGHELEVCVANAPAPNGRAPALAPGTAHGIIGMRERVALYGGTFEAHARPDGGFIVRARLPIEVGQ